MNETSITYFPMLLLSGATIPVEVFPEWFQSIAKLLPLGVGIDLLKSISAGCYDTMTVPVIILVELCEAVTEAREEADGLYFRTLPEVTAACIYHHGSYATLSETYEAVLRYIEDNGYIIDGSIRESYIDGVWNRDDERDWLTEIQIPITKK